MNKVSVSNSGIAAGGNPRGHAAAGGSARAARAAAPLRDIPPNLDTGVLFVGDGGLPAAPGVRPEPLAPLHDAVGARMGAANAAWGNDALALLRSLQKRLIGHALTLTPPERRRCLDAIAVLEPAVGMRLRILQMQMSELEGGATAPAVAPRGEKEFNHGA